MSSNFSQVTWQIPSITSHCLWCVHLSFDAWFLYMSIGAVVPTLNRLVESSFQNFQFVSCDLDFGSVTNWKFKDARQLNYISTAQWQPCEAQMESGLQAVRQIPLETRQVVTQYLVRRWVSTVLQFDCAPFFSDATDEWWLEWKRASNVYHKWDDAFFFLRLIPYRMWGDGQGRRILFSCGGLGTPNLCLSPHNLSLQPPQP